MHTHSLAAKQGSVDGHPFGRRHGWFALAMTIALMGDPVAGAREFSNMSPRSGAPNRARHPYIAS